MKETVLQFSVEKFLLEEKLAVKHEQHLFLLAEKCKEARLNYVEEFVQRINEKEPSVLAAATVSDNEQFLAIFRNEMQLSREPRSQKGSSGKGQASFFHFSRYLLRIRSFITYVCAKFHGAGSNLESN